MQIDSTLLPLVNFAGLLNLMAGKKAEALRVTLRGPPNRAMNYAPYIYAVTGDTASAMRMVREMETRQPRPWYAEAERAGVMLAVGDTARAFDALEQSTAHSLGAWTIFIPLMDPAYDGVRRSSRFAALLKKAHMDAKIFLAPDGGRER